MRHSVSTSEVKAHYDELSQVYNSRANQTCEERYFRMLSRFLGSQISLLEIGAGSSTMLDRLDRPKMVACDLSIEMLSKRKNPKIEIVQADASKLPFAQSQFDAVFSVNLLEHVEDPRKIVMEAGRVLKEGGLFLAITPNGAWKGLLDLTEKLSLKLPEGPHRFLTPKELLGAITPDFEVIEQRTFIAVPLGSAEFSSAVDRILFTPLWRAGFFQYIVARKKAV